MEKRKIEKSESEVKVYVVIYGKRRVLKNHFFSTNVSYMNGAHCKKCKKGPLGKFERVDCEFWPGKEVVESYCLDCWAKA